MNTEYRPPQPADLPTPIVQRQVQGVVIHEGDIYELRDKKGNTFRLMVANILTRNRIMVKLK